MVLIQKWYYNFYTYLNKQIGNAVPVNLANAMGCSLIRLMNDITKIEKNY